MTRSFGWIAGSAVALFALVVGFSETSKSVEVAACPDVELGEQAEDCPWAGAARAMIQEVESGRAVLPALSSILPELKKQIESDRNLEAYKGLWGQSINFDESAKGIIVHPSILDALSQLMDLSRRQDLIVHAGMEHTYGYLFSILPTSFGYKRARWVRDDIEVGFNLPRGILGPNPTDGSLFANVTYFVGRLGLRFDEKGKAALRQEAAAVAAALRSYPYDTLQPIRLEETLVIEGEETARTVVLRTDLVPFVKAHPTSTNSFLLIYSVLDSTKDGAKLITAFPVDRNFANRVVSPSGLGENQIIVTRYNAYVEGVSGVTPPWTGTRRILTGN